MQLRKQIVHDVLKTESINTEVTSRHIPTDRV